MMMMMLRRIKTRQRRPIVMDEHWYVLHKELFLSFLL